MKFEIYSQARNESYLLPFFVKHYQNKLGKDNVSFIIYDNASTDDTTNIAKDLGCKVVKIGGDGKLRDDELLNFKNNVWKDSKADFVIIADIDEFIDIPSNIDEYDLIMSEAWDMVGDGSKTPLTIEHGVRNIVYDKTNIFSPKTVKEINYTIGAHTCNPTPVKSKTLKTHPTKSKMYHMKFISEEFVLSSYRKIKETLSAQNLENGWARQYQMDQSEVRKEYFTKFNNRVKVRDCPESEEIDKLPINKEYEKGLVSIFTPCHNYNHFYLKKLISSCLNQKYKKFELILLLNGKALEFYTEICQELSQYEFIRVERCEQTGNVGMLKGIACSMANGEILVELDHDDFLSPDALKRIVAEFDKQSVHFVYSNCAEFKRVGEKIEYLTPYSTEYGWKYRADVDKEGIQTVSFPPSSQYMRSLLWAPNHVRSFRNSSYRNVGGYNETMDVADDFDLMCRFYTEYGENGFKHIDDLLYYYRSHSDQTWHSPEKNERIQKLVDNLYIKHGENMFLKWSEDNNLMSLDLGGRFNNGVNPAYKSVDLLDADIIADLNERWPWEDNTVGVIRAYHLLEHLPDTIHFFNEAFRVLAPGGFLLIEVPSTSGSGAMSDPTHIKFFNLRSFEYFTTNNLAKFIRPQYKGKFQKARMTEFFWDNSDVSVISVHMIAFKGWYEQRWCGENMWL